MSGRMSTGERFTARVGGPAPTARREQLRTLIARRGPGVHHEYEAELRAMSDDELAAELERTASGAPWTRERASGDSDAVRVLPPMGSNDAA